MIHRAIFAFTLVILLITFDRCDAKQPSDWLAGKIDRNVDLVLQIPDVQTFLREVSSLKPVANLTASQDFTQLLDQENLTLLSSEQTINLLESITEINVLVWKKQPPTESDRNNDASLFLDLEIAVACKFRQAPSVQSLEQLVSAYASSSSHSGKRSEESQSICFKRSGGWLVFGNSSKRVNEFADSIAEEKTAKPLSRDRRYMLASVEFSNCRDGLAFLFARPSAFPEFFGGSAQKSAADDELKITELSGAGAVIECAAGNVFLRTFVTNTLPQRGISAVWKSYQPIDEDLSAFSFEIERLRVDAFDGKELFEAKRNRFDNVHGKGSFVDRLQLKYGEEMKPKDVFEMSSLRFDVAYRDDLGTRRSMIINKIDNYEAAKRYFEFRATKEQESNKKKSILQNLPVQDRDVIGYGMSRKQVREKWSSILKKAKAGSNDLEWYKKNYPKAFAGTGEEQLDDLGELIVSNQGLVLTKDWLFQGQLNDVYKTIRCLEGGESINDSLEQVYRRVKRLSKEETSAPPVMFESARDRFLNRLKIFLHGVINNRQTGRMSSQTSKDIYSTDRLALLQAGKLGTCDSVDLRIAMFQQAVENSLVDWIYVQPEKSGSKAVQLFGIIFEENDD